MQEFKQGDRHSEGETAVVEVGIQGCDRGVADEKMMFVVVMSENK